MMQPSRPMSPGDWAMMGLCAIFWGSAYTFNKITIAEIPVLTVTGVRLTIAAAFLYGLARLSGVAVPKPGKAWLPFFVFTLFSNVFPFLLVLYGQKSTASGLAAVLGATTPLFLIILAHYFTHDERLEVRKLVGVIVGLFGVAVVVGASLLEGWSGSVAAKLALVSAALLYAVGAIYSKRLARHPPLVISTLQMTCGAVLMVPAMILFDKPWTQPVPSNAAISALLATAIFGSALASYTYFQVFRRAGAVNTMLVTLLVPVTPIIIGAILFGERLLLREIIGALIIAGALLINDGRLPQAIWSRVGGRSDA